MKQKSKNRFFMSSQGCFIRKMKRVKERKKKCLPLHGSVKQHQRERKMISFNDQCQTSNFQIWFSLEKKKRRERHPLANAKLNYEGQRMVYDSYNPLFYIHVFSEHIHPYHSSRPICSCTNSLKLANACKHKHNIIT